MTLSHRGLKEIDLAPICAFPRNAEELFHFHPRTDFPLTPDALARTVADREAPTVVLDGNDIAGFADLYGVVPGERCCIGNVVVDPERRGRGIARHLMAVMTEIARREFGASEIGVSCFNTNVVGLLLYPKLGFVPHAIEARQDPDGTPVALIHMSKTFSSMAG